MLSNPRVVLAVLSGLLVLPALAEAREPSRKEMDAVAELALQLAVDTDDAYVEAVYAAQPGDTDEEEALRRLYALKESASYFRDQVDVARNTPEHTTVAFGRLNNDFIDAHEEFRGLRAYGEYRQLFETIEDTIGNLRFYYVSPQEVEEYPDHGVYPYYPGVDVFVHVSSPTAAFYFRHASYWHLHPKYSVSFPYRVDYHFGYGRHTKHYNSVAVKPWHRKVPKAAPAPKRRRGH